MKSLPAILAASLLLSCSAIGNRTPSNIPPLKEEPKESGEAKGRSPYFLILLVDAPHLDYSHSQSFFQTLTKHPLTASKRGRVGHAWIYLKGGGAAIEGGHSGEEGVIRPKYGEGMLALARAGDPNPARYLFEPLDDGYFQEGSGGHIPTFAAKIPLNREQYRDIATFIHPKRYPYHRYSLTGRQCVTFVQQVASIAGVTLDCDVTMEILPTAKVGGVHYRLFSDSRYSEITFASPDKLESSLMELVAAGEAEPALHWYRKKCGVKNRGEPFIVTLCSFFSRYKRHLGTF